MIFGMDFFMFAAEIYCGGTGGGGRGPAGEKYALCALALCVWNKNGNDSSNELRFRIKSATRY